MVKFTDFTLYFLYLGQDIENTRNSEENDIFKYDLYAYFLWKLCPWIYHAFFCYAILFEISMDLNI